MQLNKSKFALAAAVVMGAWSAICALIVSVAPELAMQLFSWMVHLVGLEANTSFPGMLLGIIEVFVLTYVTAYVFAWLHNRFSETTPR